MASESTGEIGSEIDRLNQAITGLTEAVRDLRADMITIRENMRADFLRLVDRQDSYFEATRDNMRADFLRLVDRQDSYFEATRDNMRTDFSRLVDRQDSHFRWLFGLLVASTIAVGSLIFKGLH